MELFHSKAWAKKIPALFLFFLAFSLQIQITLFASTGYNGLRLNLTDLFLPLIGLFILASIVLKKTIFPTFAIKHTYQWLIALTIIFIVGLANTYWTYETLNTWGLINKFIGWFVLCAYFLMGAWLVQNNTPETLKRSFQIIIYFCLLVTIISLIASIMRYYGMIADIVDNEVPMSGLMANKNSYIFWLLFILATTTLLKIKEVPSFVPHIFWFLLPVIFLCTGARAGYMVAAIITPFLFYFVGFRQMIKPVLAFLLGILPVIIIANTATARINSIHWVHFDFIKHVDDVVAGNSVEEIDEVMQHTGDSLRMQMMYFAKDMIEKRPIIGNGLGSNVFEQEQKWGGFQNVIDSTPLWLAAEFGLIGLGLFITFYFMALWHFWKNGRRNDDPFYQKLCQSLFLMLLIFAVMSLFHEILYTRFMWFFIGLGLAYPALSNADKSTSRDTS